MSSCEIQVLFFVLLVSSMLKIANIISTPIPWPQLALNRKNFRVSNIPSSCHDMIQSWHDHLINLTW